MLSLFGGGVATNQGILFVKSVGMVSITPTHDSKLDQFSISHVAIEDILKCNVSLMKWSPG